MSYILEALRRAEAERQRGAVPGLHAQPVMGALAESGWGGPDAGSRRWRWPLRIALLGVMLGLAAGLGWWLKPASEDMLVAAKPLPLPTLPMPPTAVAPPVATSAAKPAAKPAPKPAPIPAPIPASIPAPIPAPIPVQAPAATPAQAPPVAAPIVQVMPVKPVAPAAPTVSGPVVSTTAPKAVSTAAPVQRQSPVPAPPAATEARLPTLAELPDALRREVQPLSLGGLVYAEQPALRIVIVNGQVFHEGDKPLPDLLVQQIRPKSVVFGFRGQRFELTL